jgi:hypothetical protein
MVRGTALSVLITLFFVVWVNTSDGHLNCFPLRAVTVVPPCSDLCVDVCLSLTGKNS